MPVTFSSYRLGPGQRVSYKAVPPLWDWLLRRENELEPRRSRSQIIFAVLVPPLYVAVQAPALIVTLVFHLLLSIWSMDKFGPSVGFVIILSFIFWLGISPCFFNIHNSFCLVLVSQFVLAISFNILATLVLARNKHAKFLHF